MSRQKWIACREHGFGRGIGMNDSSSACPPGRAPTVRVSTVAAECRGFHGLLAGRTSCKNSPTHHRLARDSLHHRTELTVSPHWKDMVMTLSSRFAAASLCRAPIACTAVVLPERHGKCLNRPPADQLPGVTVDAPKQMARPHRPTHHVADRSTTSRTSPAIATAAAAPMSGCREACQARTRDRQLRRRLPIELQDADKPWVGCNASGGVYSATCTPNVGNYKTYDECKEAGRVTGWRSGETSASCSSLGVGGRLALKSRRLRLKFPELQCRWGPAYLILAKLTTPRPLLTERSNTVK